MSDNTQRKEATVFSDQKLRLYTVKPVKEGAKKGSLQLKVVENNPYLAVNYGYETDKGNPVQHETPLDPAVFNQMLIVLDKVANAKGQSAFEFDNWGHPFIWDKDQTKNVRSPDKMNISRVEIGKYEDGMVYIKYCAYKKPDLEFAFIENTEWHKMKPGGQECPPNRTSHIAALAWAKLMGDAFNTYFTMTWQEPQWKKDFKAKMAQQRGGGNNNYNRSGGSGGGNNYQNKSGGQQAVAKTPVDPDTQDYQPDDDVPF